MQIYNLFLNYNRFNQLFFNKNENKFYVIEKQHITQRIKYWRLRGLYMFVARR